MKKGKQVTTILNNEQLAIFEQYKETHNIDSNFKALRLMIADLPKFEQCCLPKLLQKGLNAKALFLWVSFCVFCSKSCV